MNVKFKRLLALTIALVMVVTVFAGCGNKTDKQGTAGDDTKAAADAPETGYPIVEKPITLRYWTPMHGTAATAVPSYGDMPIYKDLEKLTNIHLEFIHPAQGMEKEAFNLMVASGDIPDIIESGWGNYSGGTSKAFGDGLIVALNDYLDEYAPNYKKILTSDKAFEREAKNDDNKILGFYTIRPVKTANAGAIFRKDWLDELGLAVPTTIDEWYEALKEFKEKKNASAPLLGNLGMFKNIALIGAYSINAGFYQENGKVKYGPMEEVFKDYITTMRKWYAEGLIDPEYATNTTAKIIDTKFTSNQAGAYFGHLGAGFANYLSVMPPKNPNFDITGVPFPTLKKGETRDFGSYYNHVSATQGACITADSKYIKEAIRLMDYGFTEEGILRNYFGYEGITYTMVDGKPTLTDYVLKNPDGLAYGTALCKYNRAPAGAISVYPFDYFKQVLSRSQQKEALATWEKPEDKKILPVGLSLTPQELEATSQKLTEIETYNDEMLWTKMIMGKEPLEKMDEYIERIKKMGIEECIKVQQAALDRYNKR